MLPFIPAIAIAALILLAVPVYLPRLGLVTSVAILALSVFLFVKPQAPITATKFNWGLDTPLAIAVLLYAVLWIGTALSSIAAERARSRQRATVIDQRGLDQVGRAAA